MKKNSLHALAFGFIAVLALGACSREELKDSVNTVTDVRGYYPKPCGETCNPSPVVAAAKPMPVAAPAPAYVSTVTADPAPVKKLPAKKHKKKKKAYDPLDGS